MSEPYWEPLSGVPFPPIIPATSLPSSPFDGQEAILVDSVTNPSYEWRFRYNAGSTSAYKWEFIGGSPLIGRSDSGASNGATLNAWVNMSASSVPVPRTGEYILKGWSTVLHPTGGSTIYAGIWVGTVANVSIYSNFGFPTSGGYSGSIAISPLRLAIAAGSGVGIAGQSNFANGSWQFNVVEILPVRVS